jgi:hypothetical protein
MQARLLREADAVAQLEAEAAALAHKREADLKLMQEVSLTWYICVTSMRNIATAAAHLHTTS